MVCVEFYCNQVLFKNTGFSYSSMTSLQIILIKLILRIESYDFWFNNVESVEESCL